MTIRPQLAERPGSIFFLADAPNDEADMKGRPLVGSDGHLLARALRLANLTDTSALPSDYEPDQLGETRRLLWERRAHSFAYVLPEPLRRGADLKEAQALRTEEDRVELGRMISITQPNIVVTLGDLALWAATGETSSEQWRGAPRVGAGVCGKVFPTYDLARLQAQYKLFTPFVADLMKVANEAHYPEVRSTEVAIWLEPDLGDLERFARDEIAKSDLLSLDIETTSNQIATFQVATSATTAIVVPFVDYRKSSRSYWDTAEEEIKAWEWVRQVCDLPIPKLGQNFANYDIVWMLERMGITVHNYRHDLRLMHHILQPELPKSLAFMGSLYTSMPRWKTNVHHGQQSSGRDKRDA